MRVGLVTCKVLPEPDPDQEPLLAALRAAGVDVDLLPWNTAQSNPADFDLCVLRSTWDYYEAPDRFMAWIEQAEKATRLWNPAAVVRWNLHKGYLRELETKGIACVPTVWIESGQDASLVDIMQCQAWEEVVIKPAISAASHRTRRFRGSQLEEGQEFLAALSADGDVMLQPYLRSVEEPGERALVWIDGAFTHAVRKSPRFSGGDEQVSDGLPLTAAELVFGEKVLSKIAWDLLYARVDIIEDERGELQLAELELMEPSLFLVQSPPALARFVDAILKAAR